MNTRTLVVLAIVAICIIALIVTLGAVFGKIDDGIPESMKEKILVKSKCPKEYGSRPLLVVSMDGFRADYLHRKHTPTLREFADEGVEAEYMISTYPTSTFPNHYSIVTGLYPESHGIVANNFYDPDFDETFNYKSSSVSEGKWWGGEAMWNTLNRQGKKSATYFWPGSEADNGGGHPTYWQKYDGSASYEERIQQVFEWLMLPLEDRPKWITLYFNEPDSTGHAAGPDSQETNDTILMVDFYIRLLLEGLIKRDILNCINIILLSDHGLAKGDKDKALGVMNYVHDIKKYASFIGGASGRISLTNKTKEAKLSIMRQLSCKEDEMRVFTPKGLPKRLHYANNRRIEDILIDVDVGYAMNLRDIDWALDGLHGYDYIFPEMNAIFLARGPDFQSGLKIKPFQNIELYNLMCYLTGVSPAENNGTWGSLHHVLRNPPELHELETFEKHPVLRYPKVDLGSYSGASGCEGDSTILEPWMPSLNLTQAQEEEIESYHAPWGIPSTNSEAVNISLLYHMDHVTGYSSTIQMPMWTTFTVGPDQRDDSNGYRESPKWASDARLPTDDTPTCNAYDILKKLNFSMVPLFPEEFSMNQTLGWDSSHLISNAIPVSQHIKGRWEGLLTLLAPSWIASQGPLNFVLGPAFDYDSNSLPDDFELFSKKPAVPTDLFCVVTRCLSKVKKLGSCPTEDIDSIAFIFHQDQPVSNCMSLEDFTLKFSSRVRDVELVTGLTLFPGVAVEHRVHQIIKIPQQLWPL